MAGKFKNASQGLRRTLAWPYPGIDSGIFFCTLCLLLSLWQFLDIAFHVVRPGEVTSYDMGILQWLHGIAKPATTAFALVITDLGNWPRVLFPLGLGVVFLLFSKKYQDALFITATTLGGWLLMMNAKGLIDRARPVVPAPILQETGFSFPSGHATVAMCLYGALAYLLIQSGQPRSIKILGSVFLALIVLAIGLSRVYLGVHYPSDVLGGYCLGIAWMSACVLFFYHASFHAVNRDKPS